MVKTIELTKGYFAIVDDADYSLITTGPKWIARIHSRRDDKVTVYACRNIRRSGCYVPQLMHRILLGVSSSVRVDHINRNGIDNRRCNLRIASHQQNMCNTPCRSDNTSGFKGVSYIKANGKWDARITSNGIQYFLGAFPTIESAAHAYDEAALKYHGEFAHLNFPGK